MDQQFTRGNEGESTLTATLSPEEFAPYVDRAAKALAAEVTIEGFRPGKAPYDVLKAKVGEQAILERAAELAVSDVYVQAVEGNDLATIGYPDVKITKLAPGNPFSFTATVPTLPDVTLPDWQNVTVDRPATKAVTDDDVTKAVEELRAMTATDRVVARPAAGGDKVELDFDIFVDNVPIDGGKSRNHPIHLSQGQFLPDFESNVIGLSAGHEKEFTFTFPKEYHARHLAGRPASAKVKVHNVKEIVLPALDDAFAKRLGNLGSLLELKLKLRENLEAEAKERGNRDFELTLFDALIAKTTFGPMPGILVDEEGEKILRELEHDLTSRGGKFDDYLASIKKSREELKAELKPQAERRVKAALVIRAIARQENVQATDQEVEAERTAATRGMPDDPKAKAQVASDDFTAFLKNRIIHRKVLDLVKAGVNVKEVTG